MNATPGIKDLLGCCIAAARGAGEHALSNEARRAEIVKKSSHDVKLALDIECQAKAEEVIRATYPSHLILGEEGGAFSDSKDPMWIIDPIDGTVNFMHGLPLWCSSVAVRVGGEVVAGAVYMPALQELFTATCEERQAHQGFPGGAGGGCSGAYGSLKTCGKGSANLVHVRSDFLQGAEDAPDGRCRCGHL